MEEKSIIFIDESSIFLNEFLDTELYVFLNKCKEKILKFIWKEKNIEIIVKYIEQLESCYSLESRIEASFDIPDIGYDAIVYKVLSKIEKEDLKFLEFGDWHGLLSLEISIYNYPDEIRNLDNEIVWTKENISPKHIEIINQKNKMLEDSKERGREYFRYLDELEILRREKVSTPKREKELIKKIKEREEIGRQYAEYKRNLKSYMEYMENFLKNSELLIE